MTKRKPESPEPSSPSELLCALAKALDRRRIAYILIGGRAVIEHGYRRTTEDIDIELSLGPWDAGQLRDLAAELDLQPKFPTAFEQVERSHILGYPVNVAAVEDLVIGKVIANRPQDRIDIDQLLLRHAPRLDMTYLTDWLARFEEVTDQPLRAAFAELLEQSRH